MPQKRGNSKQLRWCTINPLFGNFEIMTFYTSGKDDKFWAGHYGAISSAAQVRVKRESKAAPDDEYRDVVVSQLDPYCEKNFFQGF